MVLRLSCPAVNDIERLRQPQWMVALLDAGEGRTAELFELTRVCSERSQVDQRLLSHAGKSLIERVPVSGSPRFFHMAPAVAFILGQAEQKTVRVCRRCRKDELGQSANVGGDRGETIREPFENRKTVSVVEGGQEVEMTGAHKLKHLLIVHGAVEDDVRQIQMLQVLLVE